MSFVKDIAELVAREYCKHHNVDYNGHDYDADRKILTVRGTVRAPIKSIVLTCTLEV